MIKTVYVMLPATSSQIQQIAISAFYVLVTERLLIPRVTVYAMVRITGMLTKLATLSPVLSVHLQIQVMIMQKRAWPGIRKNSFVVVTQVSSSTKIQGIL